MGGTLALGSVPRPPPAPFILLTAHQGQHHSQQLVGTPHPSPVLMRHETGSEASLVGPSQAHPGCFITMTTLARCAEHRA